MLRGPLALSGDRLVTRSCGYGRNGTVRLFDLVSVELNDVFDSAGTSEKEIAVCVHWKTSGNQ